MTPHPVTVEARPDGVTVSMSWGVWADLFIALGAAAAAAPPPRERAAMYGLQTKLFAGAAPVRREARRP